jgi:Zn-dependent alcohol dehydrogenase
MGNEVVKHAVSMCGKGGSVVITGVGYYDMVLPGGILIGYHRRLQGSLFGGASPLFDIPGCSACGRPATSSSTS